MNSHAGQADAHVRRLTPRRARATLIQNIASAVLTLLGGWLGLAWLAHEGVLQMAGYLVLTAPCAKSATEYPSPDGELVAISLYLDCVGATGHGDRYVLIRTASDTRWLRIRSLFATSEAVLIRTVAWRDPRTVVVTTDYALEYAATDDDWDAYGVQLVHEYEKPLPPKRTPTPKPTPSPTLTAPSAR